MTQTVEFNTSGKKFWESKTFWVNILAIVGIVSSGLFGFEIPAEWSVSILGVVNLVLRLATKEEIVW